MKPSEIWGDKDSSLRQAFEEAVRREKEEEFMKVFTEATGAKFVDVTPVDQFKCPSYFDDLGELKDCSCGKCK